MKKRVRGMGVLITVLLLCLGGRLYYIQAVCGGALKEGAQGQQMIEIQSPGERGTIYDRNMIQLTDTCKNYYYVIPRKEKSGELAQLLEKIGGTEAGVKGRNYLVYKSRVFNKEVNEQLISKYHAYPFCSGSRYENEQLAAHLIGYVGGSDKTGEAGLEKMFQYRLAAFPCRLQMLGSGTGEPVSGAGVSKKASRRQMEPAALVTTIDSTLQTEVERILKEREVSGAAVVLQPGTGQVLAMASSPGFNPGKVEEYLDSAGGELVNKAVQGQYPPGSVFKIVVAAAALESGKVTMDETFDCKGWIEVNGVKLTCEDHPDGHGKLDFKQAFASSCNCFFASVGAKIGSETIVDMAERMGLGQAVIDGFPDEKTGSFPEKEERAYRGLSNFSIGQGSLLVTPIQIAKVTNIIASGGVDYPVSVTMSKEAEEPEGKRVMSQVTAIHLAEMMEAVFDTGTASGAELSVKAAGKTGSAESGEDGEYTVHGWFTGYFPLEEPRYTVTVIAENGKTGSSSALPVFEEIVNALY